MFIASGKNMRLLGRWQLIRCEITTAGFAKNQRAIIYNKVFGKKTFRRPEPFRK